MGLGTLCASTFAMIGNDGEALAASVQVLKG